MKVFATQFLDEMSSEVETDREKWTWAPGNEEYDKIYGSGASTATSQSTYAAEKDNRSDNDRPNEGMLIA